jgi:hypothetical protein
LMGGLQYRQARDNFRPPVHRRSVYRDRAAEVVPPREPRRSAVSFTVMAHPKRAVWAEALAERIGHGCTVTWDQKNDRHDTGIRAIRAYGPGTHHCVVQDDALVPDDFALSVVEACRWVPEGHPIGLYHGGSERSAHGRVWAEALARGAVWLARKGPIWGPGIVYPSETIQALTSWYEVSHVQNYDRRVMKFYQQMGRDCWYTVPSLVEHRQEDNPSLCGHDTGVRRAAAFIGPRSAVEVDWSGLALRSRQ